MTTTTTAVEPRVWIGCVACCNEGLLVGEWLDAESADEVRADDIHDAFTHTDAHEEIWVFDHEGLPVRGEMSPDEAAAWARALVEVEEHLRPALCAWVEHGDYVMDGNGPLPSISDFEERFAGQWSTFAEYAESLADDIGLLDDVPEEIARYFDWDSWTHDLAYDYSTIDAPNGGVFVFRSL